MPDLRFAMVWAAWPIAVKLLNIQLMSGTELHAFSMHATLCYDVLLLTLLIVLINMTFCRLCQICAANVNRSMEAHKLLKEAGLQVSPDGQHAD